MRRITIEQLVKELPEVGEFMRDTDFKTTENGRYKVGGINIFVMNAETKPYAELKYEAHERFIDIQCILEGEENIVTEPIANLTVTDPYDEKKDIIFYANEPHGTDNVLLPGDMLVLYPEDGHLPACAVNEPMKTRKAVIKVPVGMI